MDTINRILKTVLSLCLGALILSAVGCAASSKIDVLTDEGKITITPFGELGLGNHIDKLMSEVEKEGAGGYCSPSAVLLDQSNLLFRSDYFVCGVNIENTNIDWVLDLRDLYGTSPDPIERALTFYTNLRSETTADGRFIFYWNCEKPLYLLSLEDKKIYKIEFPFDYDLKVNLDTLLVTNTDDRKAYEISLDTLSVKPDPAPEVKAERTEMQTFSPDTVINAEDVLYRGSQYFVYLGEKQDFNVIDKKSGNSIDTSQFALENAHSFYSVYKDEEAVVFECDNGFYAIYKGEVKQFRDDKIEYENIDSTTFDYVYTEDETNVYPFRITVNLFDVENAVMMPYELDIKKLLK